MPLGAAFLASHLHQLHAFLIAKGLNPPPMPVVITTPPLHSKPADDDAVEVMDVAGESSAPMIELDGKRRSGRLRTKEASTSYPISLTEPYDIEEEDPSFAVGTTKQRGGKGGGKRGPNTPSSRAEKSVTDISPEDNAAGAAMDATLLTVKGEPITLNLVRQLLEPSGWLSDVHINGYLSILAPQFPSTRFMSTFFHTTLNKLGRRKTPKRPRTRTALKPRKRIRVETDDETIIGEDPAVMVVSDDTGVEVEDVPDVEVEVVDMQIKDSKDPLDYNGVAYFTRRNPLGIFSYRMVVVPVHKGRKHWCLAIIDLARRRLEFFDSMRGPASYGKKVLSSLKWYLRQEFLARVAPLMTKSDVPDIQRDASAEESFSPFFDSKANDHALNGHFCSDRETGISEERNPPKYNELISTLADMSELNHAEVTATVDDAVQSILKESNPKLGTILETQKANGQTPFMPPIPIVEDSQQNHSDVISRSKPPAAQTTDFLELNSQPDASLDVELVFDDSTLRPSSKTTSPNAADSLNMSADEFSSWPAVVAVCPQQMDASSCGVFCILCAKAKASQSFALATKGDGAVDDASDDGMKFGQADADRFRWYMAYDFLEPILASGLGSSMQGHVEASDDVVAIVETSEAGPNRDFAECVETISEVAKKVAEEAGVTDTSITENGEGSAAEMTTGCTQSKKALDKLSTRERIALLEGAESSVPRHTSGDVVMEDAILNNTEAIEAEMGEPAKYPEIIDETFTAVGTVINPVRAGVEHVTDAAVGGDGVLIADMLSS
ncbi:hypothetical protein BJ742DRAFT_842230 [Cladochytrium replicatum]|nr:hypothetical protein BJ742DRAFT_842230 [Cladochytrium replicatum]